MSERKTRKPKANAKRPPAARPARARPPANKRKRARPPEASQGEVGSARPTKAKKKAKSPNPANKSRRPKAPAKTPKVARPSSARPKPKLRIGSESRGAKTIVGRPTPAPGRPSAARRSDLSKWAKAASTRAQELWKKASPKAKAGAAATATVTARLARSSGSGLLKGAGAVGRFANRHRRTALQVLHRVAWWSALIILLIAGRDLVAFEQVGRFPAEQATFLWGLGLCAFVVATAAERRLRTGALALGGAHALAAAILIAG